MGRSPESVLHDALVVYKAKGVRETKRGVSTTRPG